LVIVPGSTLPIRAAAEEVEDGMMRQSRRLQRMVIGAIAALVAFVVGGQVLVDTLLTRSNATLVAQATRAAEVMQKTLDLAVLQKAIQLDVVQVQQFLTDVSATRGLDGLDDGFAKAQEHAISFAANAAEARALMSDLGASDSLTALAAVEEAFAPYYDLGQRMARAYVANGPEAGNRMMSRFDATAQTLGDAVAAMEQSVTALLTQFDGERNASHDAARASGSIAGVIAWTMTAVSAALGGGIIALIVLRLLRPLGATTGALERLARGEDVDDLPGEERRDEIGDLVRSFHAFKRAAAAKQRLEAEAMAQREEAEAERRREAERQAARAREQELVVGEIGKGLRSLAQGHLAYRIEPAFPAGYEMLKADFNTALAELAGIMATITEVVATVRSGGDEIAEASGALSRRTEQQAASLEQTAAAIEEITATVRSTADGATEVAGFVAKAQTRSEESATVVRDAAEAMSEIEESSRQIGQIIGVIDDIAFQTNLLALNAGVEAARSGEAGRGFAVIAQEVRSLAQRSATAAREIKALISSATKKVDRGVDLVGQTGEALHDVAGQVGQIARIVREISSSAQEQAAGVAEINTAVAQMDQMTQQNAAMAEESTAALRRLSDETGELVRLVERFDTAGWSDAARAA
jgi:methyl-accepting chemotaxis protein